jgi:hypothetical protein
MRSIYKFKTSLIPGSDITLEEFDDLTNFFKEISFNGAVGDPVSHPKLPELLKMAYNKNVHINISTAVSSKSIDFYRRCWDAHPKARWIFGIDGTPEISFVYRINQDGIKLFDIMKEAVERKTLDVCWQYIVFSYNENKIENAIQMAKDIGVKLKINHTKRIPTEWYRPKDDVFTKTNKKYETKFEPKCLNRDRDPYIDTEKQVLPCCWLDKNDMSGPLEKLKDVSLNLNNNKIKDVVTSKIWTDFFNLITKDPNNAPSFCKDHCSTSRINHSRTTTFFRSDGTTYSPDL